MNKKQIVGLPVKNNDNRNMENEPIQKETLQLGRLAYNTTYQLRILTMGQLVQSPPSASCVALSPLKTLLTCETHCHPSQVVV